MDLKFPSVLPLYRLALADVAVSLWNHVYERRIARENMPNQRFARAMCGEVQDEVLQNAKRLELPKSCLRYLAEVIKSLGLQMVSLARFNLKQSNFSSFPRRFVLSSHCELNREEIAKELVADETIKVDQRFWLACTYCIENHIQILWNQLEKFYDKHPRRIEMYSNRLVEFWSRNMVLNFVSSDSQFESEFSNSVLNSNVASTKYFFQKLSEIQKHELVVPVLSNIESLYDEGDKLSYNFYPVIFPEDDFAGVFYFLFSVMSEGQKIELLKKKPSSVLRCFLAWPFQEEFLKAVKSVREMLPKFLEMSLLSFVGQKIDANRTEYDYEELFWSLWNQIPSTHKMQVIRRSCSDAYVFTQFFLSEIKNIGKLFREETCSEKESFISSEAGYNICKKLISEHPDPTQMRETLKLLLQECALSEKTIVKLKSMAGTQDDTVVMSQILDGLTLNQLQLFIN